ncbi:MAG: LysR family transcriptional regulator [Actinobacteria bacterium]|nr:LysR family transcriptional regulator [Actinomycetota bacterium]
MSAPISWDLIPMFIVLAEELQLGAAARRLGISRQTLSRNIDRLESQLGAQVVVRTTRRVELTRAGTTLRDHAIAIERAMARAVAQVRVDQREHTLTIGASTDLPSYWYAALQEWISERGAPTLFERRGSDDALHLVRAGSLDLALVIGDSQEPGVEVVGHEPTVVVFPADHPAAGRALIRRGDLRDLLIAASESLDPALRLRLVERVHGDPSLPHVVAPPIGTITQGLIQAVRTQGAATLILERAVPLIDTDGLAVLPLDPPIAAPVVLVGAAAAPADAFRGLAAHLRTAGCPPSSVRDRFSVA